MDFFNFLKGIVIGFSLAAPIGPIGILCIRRTLVHGKWRGIVVGLSGAFADVVYTIVAAYGVTLIFDFITSQQQLLRLIGGVLLLGIGFHTYHSLPEKDLPVNSLNGHTRIFLTTLLLALINPMTLFAFAAALSSFGLVRIISYSSSITLLVAGIFIGSLLWFLLLTFLTSIFKEKVTTRGLVLVNKIAGSLLMAFGVVGVWLGLRDF